MILLCIVLYFIIGFVCLLITQILNQKGLDALDYFDIHEADDALEFRFVAMMIVLLWPLIMMTYILILFIPWIITFLYKLFVGIIFGTIALFKKEKGKDGLE